MFAETIISRNISTLNYIIDGYYYKKYYYYKEYSNRYFHIFAEIKELWRSAVIPICADSADVEIKDHFL